MIRQIKRVGRITVRLFQSKASFQGYVRKAEQAFNNYKTRNRNAVDAYRKKIHLNFYRLSAKIKGRYDLIILDDIFPQPISAFRIAEYTHYLESFNNSIIYSTATAFKLVGEKRDFKAVVREYESKHPQLRSRAFLYKKDAFFWGKVAYAVFIENAFNFIEQIEAAQIPFIFTLYPGGGFQLNNKVSDEKLRRVFASPFFRKVIVTQNVTYNYLVENKLCIESAIEFIYGVVLPAEEYKGGGPEKQKYLVDKQTFDICFVANKNMPKGEDKGFDKFIDVALNLGTKYEDIYFHVVGPFDGTEIDTSPIADKIKFYGYIHTDQFKEFYSAKDIIISPNIHFMLFPGAFDGFPTGACTEAGLNGVALFVSDTLGQNIKFKDGQDIVIIPHNSEKITEVVEEYYLNPEKTYALAERGQRRMEEIYSIDAQMGPRKTLIANILKEFEK